MNYCVNVKDLDKLRSPLTYFCPPSDCLVIRFLDCLDIIWTYKSSRANDDGYEKIHRLMKSHFLERCAKENVRFIRQRQHRKKQLVKLTNT